MRLLIDQACNKMTNKFCGAFLDQDGHTNTNGPNNSYNIELEFKVDKKIDKDEFTSSMKNSESKIENLYQ